MSKLQGFLGRQQDTILLLLLTGGFAVILGELALYQHWEGIQLVGLIATVVGLLAVLAGIFLKGTGRTVAGLLLVVLAISGLMGMRQHADAAAQAQAPRPALVQGETGVQEIAYRPAAPAQPAGETTPPPLAPLGLSGLALMGAVILLAKKDESAA